MYLHICLGEIALLSKKLELQPRVSEDAGRGQGWAGPSVGSTELASVASVSQPFRNCLLSIYLPPPLKTSSKAHWCQWESVTFRGIWVSVPRAAPRQAPPKEERSTKSIPKQDPKPQGQVMPCLWLIPIMQSCLRQQISQPPGNGRQTL